MRRKILIGFLAGWASGAAADQPTCTCANFDALQRERDNARTLRDRHQAKADEIERRQKAGEGPNALKTEYSAWESDTRNGAGKGIVGTSGSQTSAIGYVPRGSSIRAQDLSGWTKRAQRSDGYDVDVYDAKAARELEQKFAKEGRDLCDFSDEAAVAQSAEETSVCKGMAEILVKHERHHRDVCRKMGYFAFSERSAAELARDEVAAYDAQIAAIEAEIGKSLKGAEIQFEDESHMAWSARMFSASYDFRIGQTKAAIPETSGDDWSVKLKGIQKVTSPGFTAVGTRCTITGYSRDVWLTVNARNREASVVFDKFGAVPPIKTSCPTLGSHGGGMGTGPEAGGKGFTVPLRQESKHEEDIGKSEIAATAAKSGIKVSGYYRAKLSLICPAEKK